MNQYLTPLKENVYPGQSNTKAQASPRQGDWVCLNCNNLNFSFRKKCNRCKVQTREDNQRLSQYYYNSIPQPYYYIQEKENFPSLCPQFFQPPSASLPSPHHSPQPKQTPLKPDLRTELTPERWQAGLPSVSPLVQKYKNTAGRSTQESKRGGLFENESMWANIDLNYLQESRTGPFQDDDLDQMQKIIERIML